VAKWLWEIFWLCVAHPLLCVTDLAAFLGISSHAVHQLVRDLHQLGVLVPTETSTSVRWQLAETGLRLLARVTASPLQRFLHLPATTPLHQRGVKGLLHQAAHTACVYGFFATLALALVRVDGAALRW